MQGGGKFTERKEEMIIYVCSTLCTLCIHCQLLVAQFVLSGKFRIIFMIKKVY